MKKYLSILLTLLFIAVIIVGAYAFYHRFLCPMRIAIVSSSDSGWIEYQKATEGTNYAVHRYMNDDLATAPFERYDLVIMGGMGWLPKDEEVANIERASKLGTYFYVGSATQKRTQDLNNIPEETRGKFVEYLRAGGPDNTRNGFRYLAKELKGYASEFGEPAPRPSTGYFHLDETLYETVEEMDASLDAKYPYLSKDAPRIVLFGAFINVYDELEREPVDEIVRQLVARGCRVYCIMGMRDMQTRIEACRPDAGILFPIADRFLQNRGAVYRSGKEWGIPVKGLMESQLHGTELVLQARASNSWGPLGLDHVYQFNTISLAVREKTGVDPTMWFSDLRNPNKPKAQTAVQAIREESRTEFWNPKYIQGQMREGRGAAAGMVEPIRNLRGWTVVQPSAIDKSIWDEMFNVYIDDKHELGMKDYFENKNPSALQDMTAIMLDTIRKGLWKPDQKVIEQLANLHVEMVEKHGAGCSRDTCGDARLHAFLGDILPGESLNAYQAALQTVQQAPASAPQPEVEGMQLEEKIELLNKRPEVKQASAPVFITYILGGLILILGIGFIRFRI